MQPSQSQFQHHCTAPKQQGVVSRISKIKEYWNRFNEFCASCINHQISEDLLILYFNDGLSEIDRIMIYIVSGGSIMNKVPSEARIVISQLKLV